MNKKQVVARIARDTGLTKADALRAVDSLLELVGRTLKRGERVTFVGFGTFKTGRRSSRRGADPRSGAPITIPGRRMPRFSAGKDLLKLVK